MSSSPLGLMHRQLSARSPKRSGNYRVYADNDDCNTAQAVRGCPPGIARVLEALEEFEVARIAHTVDFATLEDPRFQPHWSATMVSPDMIARTLREDEKERTVFGYLWLAVRKLVEQHVRNGSIDCRSSFADEHQLEDAVFDQFLAELGCAMMEVIEGPHITFLPLPAGADSVDIIVARARRLMACFVALGRTQDQVVISIPATAAGIDAGRILHTENDVLVNLTHVAGLGHAAACAAAEPYAITLSSSEWSTTFQGQNKDASVPCNNATTTVQAIADYFRTHGLLTLLIGGALTHINDACLLTSLDAIAFTSDQASQSGFYTTHPPIPKTWAASTQKDATSPRSGTDSVPPRQRKGKLYNIMQLSGSGICSPSGSAAPIIWDRIGSVHTIMVYLRSELYWRMSLTRPLTMVSNASSTPNRITLKVPKRQRHSPGEAPPTPKRSRYSEVEGKEKDCLPTPPIPSQTREQIAELTSSLVDGSWRRRLFTGCPNRSSPQSHKSDENSAPVPADVRPVFQDGQKTRPLRPLPRRAALSQASSPLSHAAATFGADELF